MDRKVSKRLLQIETRQHFADTISETQWVAVQLVYLSGSHNRSLTGFVLKRELVTQIFDFFDVFLFNWI